MSIKARLTLCFASLFGVLVLGFAATAYWVVRTHALEKLDASLELAAGATEMSARHELSEHETAARAEADLQEVLHQAGDAPELMGIPEADQSRIFERFFQADKREGLVRKGAGLGLPIARAIIESHGGHLALAESRPGMTRFEIYVPAVDVLQNEMDMTRSKQRLERACIDGGLPGCVMTSGDGSAWRV